jgi:hypothetical protein
MKEQILEAQAVLLNESKKQMEREYAEGVALIEKAEKAIATSIANGSRFVIDVTGQTRFHTKLQFIRTIRQNLADLEELYFDSFGIKLELPKPEPEPEKAE